MNKASLSMSGTTMPIKEETRIALEELAEQMDASVQDVLAKAVDAFWRQHILEAHNAAYATLRADPHAWQEELDERRAWDVTLGDGLREDEPRGNGSNGA